jgi:hypothetical protein
MRRLLFIAIVTLLATPATAHHSLAPYAMAQLKTVVGTVKRWDWSNPHVRLNLLVADGKGGTTEWEFEGGSVSRLTTGGFVRDAVAPGDRITVSYNPRRDGTIGGFFVALTTANGTTYNVDRFRALQGKVVPSP